MFRESESERESVCVCERGRHRESDRVWSRDLPAALASTKTSPFGGGRGEAADSNSQSTSGGGARGSCCREGVRWGSVLLQLEKKLGGKQLG